MNTLVIGLGNPILTDDGIGVKIAYNVHRIISNRGCSDIKVTEASVGGLRLMEEMVGYDKVILIDAIKTKTGSKPGTLHRMSIDDLRDISPTQHSACAHDTTLVTAIDAGKLLGFQLPKDIVIIAVEVENVTDFGDEPTPAVSESIPKATKVVLGELESFNSI